MLHFASIKHPCFSAPWLLKSLDEVFASTAGRVSKVTFGIDGSRLIEDKYPRFEGFVYFEAAQANPLTEDEKDEIPAVRRMERQADQLRYYLPIPFDSEGHCQGDWTLVAQPGSLRFIFDARGWEPDGAQIHIHAKQNGSSWDVITEVRFDIDSESLSLQSAQDELESRLDPGYFHISMPQALSASIQDELDDGDNPVLMALRTNKKQVVITLANDAFSQINDPYMS